MTIWPVTALPRHHGLDPFGQRKSAAEWTSEGTTTQAGQEAGMRGRKRLAVQVGDQEVVHEFWLADIRDPCIIGLDLLIRWGVRMDMAGAAITVGAETVALQAGRGEHRGSGSQRGNRRVNRQVTDRVLSHS